MKYLTNGASILLFIVMLQSCAGLGSIAIANPPDKGGHKSPGNSIRHIGRLIFRTDIYRLRDHAACSIQANHPASSHHHHLKPGTWIIARLKFGQESIRGKGEK